MLLDDYKDASGEWVRAVRDGSSVNQTRSYRRWAVMIQRCKSGGPFQINNPAYVGCINGFRDFQTFADWCQQQIGYLEEGFQLDKDILGCGKLYSPDACVFVPADINKFLVRAESYGCPYGVGVKLTKSGKFQVNISGGSNKTEYVGTFATAEKANAAYATVKERNAKLLAAKWDGKIDSRVNEFLLSFKVKGK